VAPHRASLFGCRISNEDRVAISKYLKGLLFRSSGPLIHLAALFTRPLTLGVRGAVIKDGKYILLVRHGYVAGWHLPGGGVESGESALVALKRELKEEAAIDVTSPPSLRAVHHNGRRDHVLLYLVDAFTAGTRLPNWEIREARFFPVDALPNEITSSTRLYIDEIKRATGVACPR
jgi:ADP-ribose pyrophosphatase YjhB (NUDIX family)